MNMLGSRITLGRFTPDGKTRASRMLALGRLTATVTSKATQKHVTLRLRAKDRERGWDTVAWDEASHVFIEDYDAKRVATYYPTGGALFFKEDASEAARWATKALLLHTAGANPSLDKVAWVDAADLCGRCGNILTSPTSVERGFGPTCWGEATRDQSIRALVEHVG